MEKRCYECMEPISDGEICPECGFDNEADTNKGSDFKGGTFLKTRYYIGNVFSKTLDSTVYIAYDEELNKKVFVREFTGEGIAKLSNKYTATELRKKFLTYAKGTATLNMCNLLPHTTDVFEEDDRCYLVSDYFDGESLKTLLSSGIRISSSNALKMAKQLLNGLDAIHNTGLIFGAISPETLYILKNGEVRIFGLASRFYDFLEDLDCRVEVLNPSYAAPELFEENPKISIQCDVYSVAAILYRILTNKIPAIGFLRSGGENLTSPKKINKNISKNVSIALLNALNWQIECRTATTADLLNELSAKKVKRVRSGAIIWANILGFFQKSHDQSEKDSKKGFLWLWILIPIIILIGIIVFLVFFSPKPTEETAEISHDSTSIEDGWYYGSGIETPTSSNDYVYGGQSSEKRNSSKRTRPNYNGIYFNSSSRTSSSMSNSSDAALSQTSSDSSDVTSGSDQNTEADDEYLEADFIGYYLDDSYMAKADIKIGEITFGVSNDHAVNQIIDHNPKNKKIKKGTKVDFVLCKLPDVSGTNLYQSIDALTGAGVSNIEFKFDESSNKAPGTVIKNYFADESDFSRNSKVIIEVSGKEIGTIADFSKETAASVRGKYPNINFIFKNGEEVIEISDIDAALYKVKSQDIPANSPAYEGVTVTLTVEK